ncbi:MAG: ECF transporter S component [Clostridia bacterium]|nr:ECF transporter S component [Clostridia bacterium]
MTKKLTLSAMFMALGFILPLLFGQLPQIGSMLLPMHIPVFLCAFICGFKYAVPMSFLLPLLRSVLFNRPNLYPEAIAIAFELATYALAAGILYEKFKGRTLPSLLISMAAGRLVRCIIQLFLLGIIEKHFIFSAFFAEVIAYSIPGIILQIVLIPTLMIILKKTNILKG